jgi:hypothetical protein
MRQPILQPTSASHSMSPASRQALAILAVDGIRPSQTGIALMQSVDSGSMTHAQAIQLVIERAQLYAKHQQ